MPTSYLQTEETGTVNKARVLKCRAAAHLIGFFIPSYACTLQNIRSRQGKQNITISQQSFILIFMRPIERNQVFTSVCEFLPGETLGSPQARKEQRVPQQAETRSLHTSLHTPPSARACCHGKAMGKLQGKCRMQDLQKALPCSHNTCFLFMNLSKEAFSA